MGSAGLRRAQAKPELVIVAGLSGAGKTTFLRQLKDNTLPPCISGQLPSASGNWPVRMWPKRTERSPEAPDSGSKGLVLHLALNTLGDEGRCHELRDLIDKFHKVTVVHILARPDRLVEQLKERSFESDRFSRLILGLVNPRGVSVPGILKLPVLSLLAFRQKKLKTANARHKIARILSRLDAYTHHPERLEKAKNGLRKVLRSASEAGIEIKQIRIEPAPVPSREGQETYQWRQLDG
jgi:hypothetical protein